MTHTLAYTYNGDGVRVASAVDGAEVRFAVMDQVGLPQVLVEVTGTHVITYLYGLARLAQLEGSEMEWHLGDALGSVRQLVGGDGEVILARKYEPYGQVLAESASGSSGYGYTGEEFTPYNKYVYLRTRWYDPVTGRFLSPDAWTGSIYQPSSLHKYLYVSANPIRYVDPTGHQGGPHLEFGTGGGDGRNGQTDPVFGGEDFLSNNPIPPSTRPNIYTSQHLPFYKLAFNNAVNEYNIPPELLAVVLQLENNYPRYGYFGYVRRTLKMASTPILQVVWPGHDEGWGWSQGLGNIKPKTAQETARYFELHYCSGQSVEGYSSHFILMDIRRNLQYAAAHLRRQIDDVYGLSYRGPMSLDGLTLVISRYNRSGITYVSSYGADGQALLIAASRGEESLYFLRE